MSDEAGVRSIEALETFRSALIVFLAKAKRSLDTGADEVRRTRDWLRVEQRAHWEREIRVRSRALDQANQELMSARFSSFIDTPMLQTQAVRKAKAALERATEKAMLVKKWSREFENKVDPMAKRLETLRDHIAHELPKAVHWLSRAQTTLDAYTGTAVPSSPGAASPAVEAESAASAEKTLPRNPHQ